MNAMTVRLPSLQDRLAQFERERIAAEAAEAERKAAKRAATADEVRIREGQEASAWLVVLTKGGREGSVRDRLRAQGFEVYVPLRLLTPLQAEKRGVTSVPLFPRIVFARATLDAYRWQAIFSTIGITRVMCDPKRPRGLKPQFIERLRAREIEGFRKAGLVDPDRPAPPPPSRDPRKWVKLDDVVAGLWDGTLDEHRGSVLVSLLSEGSDAITQTIRRGA